MAGLLLAYSLGDASRAALAGATVRHVLAGGRRSHVALVADGKAAESWADCAGTVVAGHGLVME